MTASHLDARQRARTFNRLSDERFDVLVIGGGVTGAGIARDAALRGLRTALIEAGDYASGTSSRSSKMIHGGLRYLAQGDVQLVREAASERQTLRRIAPHLARLTPFVMPTPNLGVMTKMRAALFTFEKLGGVPAQEAHETWTAQELAEREPPLRPSPGGAVVYPEFLTDDARLVIANVRDAQMAGAAALNYVEAVEIVMEGALADGCVCRSTLPGENQGARIRARLVINAAGPWVDAVRRLEAPGEPERLSLTKGVHVVVDRDRLPIERTVIFRASDKRSVFAVPRGATTYIGTTDTFYPSADRWPVIVADDVAYLLQASREAFSTPTLGPQDVTALWSGVRPLVAQPGRKASEISRKDEVWTGPCGVVTIAGGKLSAYRAMAERIVDDAVRRLALPARACETHERPLPGGEGLATAAFGDRLKDLYGGEAGVVAADGGDVAAEARAAVRMEGAARLEDYLVRRSARAWFDPDGGAAAVPVAAAAMAELLGWSDARRQAEIDHCQGQAAADRACLKDLEAAA